MLVDFQEVLTATLDLEDVRTYRNALRSRCPAVSPSHISFLHFK